LAHKDVIIDKRDAVMRFKYRPEMPPEQIKDFFESRTTSEMGWPQGKPLPDLDQFVDRSIVNEVLKEMGRKPGAK
jgi:hypothetical protein